MAWTNPKTWSFKEVPTSAGFNEQIRDNMQFIHDVIEPFIAEDSWHVIGTPGEPAFSTDWSNYGGSFNNAAFRKLPGGKHVELRGLVQRNTVTTGDIIFTLPMGYRPLGTYLLVSIGRGSGGTVLGRINVASGGSVAIVLPINQIINWISLDGLVFAID